MPTVPITDERFSRGSNITPFERSLGVVAKQRCRCGSFNHLKKDGDNHYTAHCPWCGTWYTTAHYTELVNGVMTRVII